MPLVKVKPTSNGRRSLVKVVNPNLHKGAPVASLVESQKRGSGRNNNGHITMRHKGGGHKQHYRIVDFKRNKDGIPAKVERLEYDPNRSANIALLLYADGERRYIIAPRGVAEGTQLHVGRRSVDQAGQHAAAAQHSGRHDDPLHRDAAGQGRADGAFGRRRRAAAGARRRVCAGAPALRRNSQGARRLPRDDRRSRQRGAQPALDRQGGRAALARHPADGARHRDESGRPSDGWPHQRRWRMASPGVAMGHAGEGLQDAPEQADRCR